MSGGGPDVQGVSRLGTDPGDDHILPDGPAVGGDDLEVPDAGTRGRLEINDRAVRRLAEQAAAEVSGWTSRPTGMGALATRSLPHVSATLVGRHARLRVDIASAGERSLPELAQAVRDHVASRVAELTGMTVDVVDVHVDRLVTPVDGAPGMVLPPAAPSARPGAARAAGTVMALLLIPAGAIGVYDGLVGLDLFDGDTFTGRLLEWLDGMPPETWMVPVGVALALLGLWLVIAALRPRPRHSLPLTSDTGVYVTRRAIESLVADTAARQPGVLKARAKARRRSVTLRGRVDENGGTQGEVRLAVHQRIVRLARPLRLRVALRAERRPS